MLGKIIKHRIENVEFFSLKSFKNEIINFMCLRKDAKIEYDVKNRGITINGKFHTWRKMGEMMEWFDDAEIVTDKNESERVMVWLNVA